ncbi:MAG: KamA family radical SAM protein [bacterium]|nr:KamA family radical SAM protein [bacterium]
METWQEELKKSVRSVTDLKGYFSNPVLRERMFEDYDFDLIEDVVKKYPMRITRYYLSLIRNPGDPLWKQAIPDPLELLDTEGVIDPLNEERDSPVRNLVHRYPDRVLFIVSNQCAIYCRFCTRKRRIGRPSIINEDSIQDGLRYIQDHKSVRDVILSGGDPLLLTDEKLERILQPLRQIQHVEIIRIGTRVPVTLPSRITNTLVNMLKKYHPLYINTHFNHPDEITTESSKACITLADAGIPLGNQTVLLRGVNDDSSTIKQLMLKLLTIRVKPYYIYQADLTLGTKHFRTRVEEGLKIMKNLAGYTSGLAVPHFVIDSPGGGGKVAITPNNLIKVSKEKVIFRNYLGRVYCYPQPSEANQELESQTVKCKVPAYTQISINFRK